MTGSNEGVTAAAPDELRWGILQAALAGDLGRHDRLMAEAADVERLAASNRAARAAAAARADRLF